MRTFAVLKFLPAVLLFPFLLSCQKETDKKEDNNPPPPVIPISGTDTGKFYNAQAVCNYNYDEAILTSAGWTKALEDNFNTDLSKWTVYTGGNSSRELQYYKESNVFIENGVAQVAARRETISATVNGASKTFDFTSGQLQSKGTFSANDATPKVRIVARIKLPKGYGLQPAFLTTGDDYPKTGQINMIMANGNDPRFYATNYAYGPGSANLVRDSYGYITADADLSACYHVYETEWTKNSLNFYLDGRLVEQKTSGGYVPGLFGKTHRLVLYMVVTSDLLMRPQIKPGNMSVDWIKVFTSR
ncbi:MAG TPA: glycoside hydrolase family 16 protein [Flavisolibacter sp.]|nr:glycoside hydrolase family 16 protein [Flavisolibacter sp.]